ncbi:MAG TPA: hypothetical protein VGH87_27530 [Polyangiaceae bacterium]
MKRALLLLPLITGCYSFSTIGRAHTIGKGHVEAFAAPAALVVPAPGGVAVRPVAEIGARVGVTDNVDLEGRVTSLGGSFATHIQLRRDREAGSWEAMLAPGVAYTAPDKLAFELPIVFGVNVDKRDDQLVIAPRLAYQLRFGSPQVTSYFFTGISLGFAWRVVRHFTFMPEASLLTQLYSSPGYTSNTAGTAAFQLAAALLFDF